MRPQQTALLLMLGPSRKSKPAYCYAYRSPKIRYRDRKDAKKEKMRLEGKRTPYLRVYKCPHCNGWHLTSAQPHREDNHD